MERIALIAGASGLVGGKLVSVLINSGNYKKIHLLGRKSLFENSSIIKNHTVSLDSLIGFEVIDEIDEVYICLGTTLKKAGSIESFRKVDLTMVVEIAKWAKNKGVTRLSVISSVGANRNKKNYYLRTKGEMEQALMQLKFEHLVIIRPSLLLGKRAKVRLGEKIGLWVSYLLFPIFVGPLKKYKPVKAKIVAKQMFNRLINSSVFLEVVENDQLVNYQ